MTGRSDAASPLLVGCSGARDVESAARDARSLVPEVDLLEVRLDRFADPQAVDLAALARAIGRPAICTLRTSAEGGEFAGDSRARLALLERADAAGFAWIDVESDLADALRRGRARRIVSWHGPSAACDGAERVRALLDLDADVVKVAASAEDPAEALRFVQSAASAGSAASRPVAAIAMGEAGRYLRPLAGLFGMPLLYAALHPARKTAAGQITAQEALEVHRAKQVGPRTRVFAVAGRNVSASLSPSAHNSVFSAQGCDSVYTALSAGSFAQVAEVARSLPLAGLSVTAPFKASALAFAGSAGEEARGAGVANTLLADPGGSFRAECTDAPGFLAALDLALARPEAALDVQLGRSLDALLELDGAAAFSRGRGGIRTALVYGTGGAARTVAWALCERGVSVRVTGRSQEKATALVLSLGRGVEAVSPARAAALRFDLLVKAVPDLPGNELPLDPFDFAGEGFAADLVYSPLETSFLLAARRAGRRTIPGLLMFSEQAVLQAALFLGLSPGRVRPAVVAGIARGLSRAPAARSSRPC